MEEYEARKLINNIFTGIESAVNCEGIKSLLNNQAIPEKCKLDIKKYPRIQFTISAEEVQELREKGVLNNDLILENNTVEKLDPLIKLFYSILWKNGDLQKLKHIIKGIVNSPETVIDKEDAIVFRQFGHFLADHNEPIIDQHVIRAFRLYRDEQKDFEYIRYMDTLNKKHLSYVSAYKTWLKSDRINDELKKQPDYIYYIDQVLFAVGKAVKKRKKAV